MSRSGADRVSDIVAAAESCTRYLALRDSATDPEVARAIDDAIRYNLEIVGEAAARLPAEVVDAHPEVPWVQIRGFRNILIHQYFDVDPDIVRDVVENHLPGLVATLRPHL